jgi:DNA-directed RNA polymerase subunit RPC12/RpoP
MERKVIVTKVYTEREYTFICADCGKETTVTRYTGRIPKWCEDCGHKRNIQQTVAREKARKAK